MSTDQPDGIDGASFDMPLAVNAARRVDAFVRWWGDGLIAGTPDEPRDPPLYARDLAALTRVVLGDPRDPVHPGSAREALGMLATLAQTDHEVPGMAAVPRYERTILQRLEQFEGCIAVPVASLRRVDPIVHAAHLTYPPRYERRRLWARSRRNVRAVTR